MRDAPSQGVERSGRHDDQAWEATRVADERRDADPARPRATTWRRDRATSAASSGRTSASCSSRAGRSRRCASSSRSCGPSSSRCTTSAPHSSRKLLAGIARGQRAPPAEARDPAPGLRHAAGHAEFIEWPTAQGAVLRFYTTEIDADTASRNALARMLLANSRLGVVIVGDLPPHAVTAALQPLQRRDDARPVAEPPPADAAAELGQRAGQPGLAARGHTGVSIRTTPQVTRPAEAWTSSAASGTTCTISRRRAACNCRARGATEPPGRRRSGRAAPPPPALMRPQRAGDAGIVDTATCRAAPLPLRPMPPCPARTPRPATGGRAGRLRRAQ